MQTPSDKQRRREEAAEWFAALRAGLMPAESRAEFDRWRADPLNQAALDSIHVMWGELAALKDGAVAVERPVRRLPSPVAAAFLLVVGGAALATYAVRSAGTSVETAVGQQRTQSLPDGSLIAVNVVSQVSYTINDKRRRATVREGEAAFTVRDDSPHVFVVQVGDFDIRSSKAEFNVLKRDGQIEVAVSSGSVEVCRSSGPQAGNTISLLESGQVLQFPADWRRLSEEHPRQANRSPKQIAEWRTRTMTYEGAEVAAIVDDFNRFFERKLLIRDTALAHRVVTLRLQVNDRTAAVDTLASLLDARVRETDSATVLTSDNGH